MNLVSVVLSITERRILRDGSTRITFIEDHQYCTIEQLIAYVSKKQGITAVNIRIDTCGSNFLLDTECDYTKFINMASRRKSAIFINSTETNVSNCSYATITYSDGEYVIEPMGRPRFITNTNIVLDAMRLATQLKKRLIY